VVCFDDAADKRLTDAGNGQQGGLRSVFFFSFRLP
jgi:hypothetical protein